MDATATAMEYFQSAETAPSFERLIAWCRAVARETVASEELDCSPSELMRAYDAVRAYNGRRREDTHRGFEFQEFSEAFESLLRIASRTTGINWEHVRQIAARAEAGYEGPCSMREERFVQASVAVDAFVALDAVE